MVGLLLCVQKLVRKILGNRSVTSSLHDAAANFYSRAKCRRRWTDATSPNRKVGAKVISVIKILNEPIGAPFGVSEE